MKKVSIYDFLYIASILKVLFERKDYQMVVDLMKPYNLILKDIESIIKIDKINKPKQLLTGKKRTTIRLMLGEKIDKKENKKKLKKIPSEEGI